jgi:hypothetical protein
MVAVKLQERLTLLEQTVASRVRQTASEYWLCYCKWPEPDRARFHALWNSRQEGLTEAEAEELYAGIAECRVAFYEDLEDEMEDDDNDQDEIEEENQQGDNDAEGSDADEDEYEKDATDMCPHGERIIRAEWEPTTLALVLAFHKYADAYCSITLPEHDNLLKQFLLNTLRRLFEKYGWVVGQPDCTTILPLDRWIPADRKRLEDLYGDWC